MTNRSLCKYFKTSPEIIRLSIVMTPVADGSTESASLFDGNEKYNDTDPVGFELIDVQKLKDGSAWPRYSVKSRDWRRRRLLR